MGIKKKVIGVSLATVMGLGIVATDAIPHLNSKIGIVQAAEQTEGDFTYLDNGDGTATIKNYIGTDTHMVVPEEINGLTVTHLGKDRNRVDVEEGDVSKLTEVTIPDSVTRIGRDAFTKNKALKKVNLSETSNLKEIGQNAFGAQFSEDGIDNLEITLPEGLEKIELYAFANAGLDEINLPNSLEEIGSSAFLGNNLTKVVIPEKITKVVGFKDNNLEEVVFKGEVTEIQGYAFSGNKFKELKLPKTVKSIGQFAFSYNVELEEIELSENLEEIGNYAFSNNHALKQITIPASVDKMGWDVFLDSKNLRTIIFEGSPGPGNVNSRALDGIVSWNQTSSLMILTPEVSTMKGFANNKGFSWGLYTPPEPEPEETPETGGGEGENGGGADADGNTSSSMDARFNIGSGLFELDASKIESFGNIEMPEETTEYTASFESPFNVKDFSGKQLGWRVDVTASQFEVDLPNGEEGYKLPVGTLELSPLKEIKKVGNGTTEKPVSKIDSKTFIDDGTVTVVSAKEGEGIGEYILEFPEEALTLTLDPEKVKIDVENFAGQKTPYKSKVSWDLVQAP